MRSRAEPTLFVVVVEFVSPMFGPIGGRHTHAGEVTNQLSALLDISQVGIYLYVIG